MLLQYFEVSELGAQQQFCSEIQQPQFSEMLKKLISHSVPEISVTTLYKNQSKYIILDAREYNEFLVSKIPNARWIGYKDFKVQNLIDIDKNCEMVIYCSVGYRSEKIVEKLKKAGYSNVSNLYGSIFEWSNRHYPLIGANGNITDSIHVYSKSWGKYVYNQNAIKIY